MITALQIILLLVMVLSMLWAIGEGTGSRLPAALMYISSAILMFLTVYLL